MESSDSGTYVCTVTNDVGSTRDSAILTVEGITAELNTVVIITRSSATAEIARDAAIQGHSRSSVVVPIDAALYDLLLALNSNLTSIFNRS